jgi:hypothetical protein
MRRRLSRIINHKNIHMFRKGAKKRGKEARKWEKLV